MQPRRLYLQSPKEVVSSQASVQSDRMEKREIGVVSAAQQKLTFIL